MDRNAAPSPSDRLPEPERARASVDWWAWQSRVRDVAEPARTRARGSARRARLGRAGLGVLVGGALVVATFGGVVLGGRPTDAAPARRLVASGAEAVLPVGFPGDHPAPPEVPLEPAPEPPLALGPPPAPEPSGRFVVGREVLDLSYDGRRLQTVVRFPADGGTGPFPMVVFAHGYGTRTEAFGSLLDGIASTGFVVVAPEFPNTSTAYGGVGGRDVVAQVDDVRHAITAVRDLAQTSGSPLARLVDDRPVGVVGHSDGGVTAAAAAFASHVRDQRVGAAVVLSGARGDFGGPWFLPGSPALLAIHGDADGVNPFGASQTLYSADRSGAPRYLVSVRGGGHDDAFVGSQSRAAVIALVNDFLRASLVGDAKSRARIPEDAAIDGVLELVAFDA